MILNIIELILILVEICLLVIFFVILKKNGEETIEEVKGKLMRLANAMLINFILYIIIVVVDGIIDFIK